MRPGSRTKEPPLLVGGRGDDMVGPGEKALIRNRLNVMAQPREPVLQMPGKVVQLEPAHDVATFHTFSRASSAA